MRSRALATAAVVGSAAWLLALAQPSVAAPHASAAATTHTWSAAHGSADASGTRWLEPGDFMFSTLRIDGSLHQSGSGCSSLWVRWTFDLAPSAPRKVATQCGTGSTPVSVTLQNYMPTTTGSVAVCDGDADTDDCGTWKSVTSW
jgi:hypothetical protein